MSAIRNVRRADGLSLMAHQYARLEGRGLTCEPEMAACTHLDRIRVTELPASIAGCEACLKTGDRWVHLRMCLTCGKIGCCDSSPNRHASRHAREDDHPIARSAEPGESWSWCFVDLVEVVVPEAG